MKAISMFKREGVISVTVATIVSLFLVISAVQAVTTISTDIATGGALSVTGATTLTGLASIGQASSTRFSVFDTAYFGGTATSTFNSAGVLTLASALGATSGGTGQSTLTTGDILYSSATNVLSKLGIGTGGFVLGSVGGIPGWVATSTLSTITGTLSVAKGGTGQTSFGQGWLHSDGATLSASTSPTVNYIIATSTTATSTFAGGISGTSAAFTGTLNVGTTTLSGALNEAATVIVASVASTPIGAAASNNVDISGTVTITSFDTAAEGINRKGRFTGVLTLTHNATSLILPGAANITTAVNDRYEARSLGSGNWIVTKYQKANGTAVVATAITGVAFSAHKNSVNQTIATATWTLVTFGTEEFDVNGNFASNRFTPTVAGKYLLTAALAWLPVTNAYGHFVNIYKNGVEYKRVAVQSSGVPSAQTAGVSIVVDANGSTDYFEVFAYQATGGNVDIDGASRATFFTGGRTF